MYISSPFLCNAATTASPVKDRAALKLPFDELISEVYFCKILILKPPLCRIRLLEAMFLNVHCRTVGDRSAIL
jgi:hypothetical protein